MSVQYRELDLKICSQRTQLCVELERCFTHSFQYSDYTTLSPHSRAFSARSWPCPQVTLPTVQQESASLHQVKVNNPQLAWLSLQKVWCATGPTLHMKHPLQRSAQSSKGKNVPALWTFRWGLKNIEEKKLHLLCVYLCRLGSRTQRDCVCEIALNNFIFKHLVICNSFACWPVFHNLLC